MSSRAVLLILALVVTVSAVGAWRVIVAREVERREALETSQTRSWARSEAGAGISAVPKRVTAAPERTLRQVRDLPGYHEFATRCASCHVLPDPTMYDSRQWSTVTERMRHHADRSGTIPPPESDLHAVLDFLRAASQQANRQ